LAEKEIIPRFQLLPRVNVPLVDVSLPSVELPSFPPKVPKLDDRQMDVVRYAVMEDLADLVPVVGDVAEDLAYAELKRRLTPEELEAFTETNKNLPSTLAALKVFAEKTR